MEDLINAGRKLSERVLIVLKQAGERLSDDDKERLQELGKELAIASAKAIFGHANIELAILNSRLEQWIGRLAGIAEESRLRIRSELVEGIKEMLDEGLKIIKGILL